VGADRVCAGVRSLPGQLLAKPDDLLLYLRGNRLWAGARAPRPRLERGLALGEIPLDELDHPLPRDVVVAGDLALGASLDDDDGDDQSGLGHVGTSGRGVNDVPRQVSTMSWNQTLPRYNCQAAG
jgi:hypothetical protein